MVVFPHAKINLGLNVVRKRSDGYHDIETVFAPIPLRDALEAVVDDSLEAGTVTYTRSGLTVQGERSDDLVMRAYRSVALRHKLPGLRMHLHKTIPLGAGLGGGSSDATHALRLLNGLLALSMGPEEMHAMALQLGSDCPYFLSEGVQEATGRGDVLKALPLRLNGLWVVVVNPGIHVPTSLVFSAISPSGAETGFALRLTGTPLEEWRVIAPNTMEDWVFSAYPPVGAIRDKLLDIGAAHAAMSGSGSTVFGIFREEPTKVRWPQEYLSWTFLLP
ncbi:MAG: 4-(cytidine 5'-diphospho)-2-C-methyl-D-erythritol kinase [Flavobacteriales bacterium]|nr:4-(cytidine 5'-diphospho)-2-C-methyl-D-erythritol kinase [Flavobacteriales bacterium]